MGAPGDLSFPCPGEEINGSWKESVGALAGINSRIANLVKGPVHALGAAPGGALDKIASDSAKLEPGLEEKCFVSGERAFDGPARRAWGRGFPAGNNIFLPTFKKEQGRKIIGLTHKFFPGPK